MIDIAVIGCGPAGLSAAINGAQRNKKVTIFGRGIETSMTYKADKIDNYIGMPEVTGRAMMESFYSHAISKGVEIKKNKVYQIFKTGDYYTLNVDNNFIEARSVIIASGITKSKEIKGEKEYVGRGVSYCATCDGMFFRGKTVSLITDNNEGIEDMRFLSEVCGKVYFVPNFEYKGELPKNVELVIGKPKSIEGEETVKSLNLEDKSLNCDGVFIIKESVPVTSLIEGLEMENGAIKVGRNMDTNLKGIYAAGDCTGAPYQISKAVGEGLVAALSAAKLLK